MSNNFSIDEFFDPDNKYYPIYTWMWNEELNKNEIKNQIDEMYDRNIKGIYVVPLPKEFRPKTMTTNMQPDYLSDGYFDMITYACEYAVKKGMIFWLYDEGGWPSGNANGLVVKDNIKFRLKHIDKGGIKKSNKADLTNKEVTKKFITITHEGYKTKMGESFKNLGPVVFTDEPDISALPFTKSIKQEYKKRTGKRLSLIKLKKHNNPQLNIIYHDICADLFAENYFKPIKKWCNENGLLSAGHLDKDNESYGFRKSHHHPLRLLRQFDIPGVDAIWGQINPDKYSGFFPRLASSAASQTGSGLSLTESLSVYGTLTYDQMRYILGYQLVRGINILNLMLLMYNEKEYYALRQRPSFSKNLPSAEYLPEFNKYFASLQYIMQGGKPDTDCALYLPMRALWADDEDTEAAMKSYEEAGRKIESNHGQFDIIDDDFILNCDEEKLHKGILSTGIAEYTTIYITFDKHMQEKVRKHLDCFNKNGGKIYYNGHEEYLPKLDISGDDGKLRVHKRIYNNCKVYILFNECNNKVNANISFSESAKELDILNKKVYRAKGRYCFESGEIKIFIEGNINLQASKTLSKGNKICTLNDFKVKQLKKFSLDKSGMSYIDLDDSEVYTKDGSFSTLYGDDFSGKCQFITNFTYNGKNNDLILCLGKICYSCEMSINGVKIADLFMPPYETVINESLLKEENELIITVSNTATNAFVHFDIPKEWERKHIGPYHEKALELEKKILDGGLLGSVEIYEAIDCD